MCGLLNLGASWILASTNSNLALSATNSNSRFCNRELDKGSFTLSSSYLSLIDIPESKVLLALTLPSSRVVTVMILPLTNAFTAATEVTWFALKERPHASSLRQKESLDSIILIMALKDWWVLVEALLRSYFTCLY